MRRPSGAPAFSSTSLTAMGGEYRRVPSGSRRWFARAPTRPGPRPRKSPALACETQPAMCAGPGVVAGEQSGSGQQRLKLAQRGSHHRAVCPERRQILARPAMKTGLQAPQPLPAARATARNPSPARSSKLPSYRMQNRIGALAGAGSATTWPAESSPCSAPR